MSQAVLMAEGKAFESGAGERLLTQRDRRADGGARHVRVTRGDILIARRFGGVAMMIAAPVEAYRGVGLTVCADVRGDILYRLILVHRDADLDIVLIETRNSADAQTAWGEWAAWFNLSRLAIQNEEWVTVSAPAGARPAVDRRRSGVSARRRPAFLARRKVGDARRLAEVFANEREMAGYA
jgi:hypothetical protein